MQIYTSFVKKSSKWAVEKNGVFETENVWILHIQFDLIFFIKITNFHAVVRCFIMSEKELQFTYF